MKRDKYGINVSYYNNNNVVMPKYYYPFKNKTIYALMTQSKFKKLKRNYKIKNFLGFITVALAMSASILVLLYQALLTL